MKPPSVAARRWKLLVTTVLVFVGVFLAGAILAHRSAVGSVRQLSSVLDLDSPMDEGDAAVVNFAVASGDSAARIGERLEAIGLIRHGLSFRLLARSNGAEQLLAAGDYEIRRNMRPSEIIRLMLERSAESSVTVTIPEGWRVEEIGARLEASGVVSRTEFLAAARSGGYPYEFLADRPAGSSLEGYLFPDTYSFTRHVTATRVVDIMLLDFDRRFNIALRQQAERQGLSVAQVVVLGSIVEREAVVSEERPMIAEVFLNRLALNMPLQADATVQYAAAIADPQAAQSQGYWKRELTATDLALDSPYNTYLHRGLPPGAISAAGLASLSAVVSPTSTGYLYFVAKADGGHAFARTLSDHNENVARYRASSKAR